MEFVLLLNYGALPCMLSKIHIFRGIKIFIPSVKFCDSYNKKIGHCSAGSFCHYSVYAYICLQLRRENCSLCYTTEIYKYFKDTN